MNKIIINRTIVAIAIMLTALLFTAKTHAQNMLPSSASLGILTTTPNTSSISAISK